MSIIIATFYPYSFFCCNVTSCVPQDNRWYIGMFPQLKIMHFILSCIAVISRFYHSLFISSHYMNFDEKCLYCLQLAILLAGQTYLLLERDQKTVLVRRTLAQGDRGLRPPYFYVRFTDHGIEKLNKLWVIYQVSISEQQ